LRTCVKLSSLALSNPLLFIAHIPFRPFCKLLPPSYPPFRPLAFFPGHICPLRSARALACITWRGSQCHLFAHSVSPFLLSWARRLSLLENINHVAILQGRSPLHDSRPFRFGTSRTVNWPALVPFFVFFFLPCSYFD